ncbi:MAG TPA: DUF3826 domain-containing protein [Niabella sp.]|nr:DUF3826 domain-containing protein [Niabella sp.]
MQMFSKKNYFLFILIAFALNAQAQSIKDDDYMEVVKGRAFKIAAPLGIKDSAKFYRVRDKIAQEYAGIKTIDDEKEAAVKAVKAQNLDKAAADAELAKITSLSEEKRIALNKGFVQSLAEELSAGQVEEVKNGLTYNVLPLTYKAHLDMIPTLKEEEKKYIYDALYEAREHAMAAGSSDAKHAWFGKYKGRINNYLASRGYDLTKEREAWYERIKAAKK